VRHADRIIVLTENGVGEEGSHDALMAKDGLYASLYRVQGSI
jgi:ATP-binding cassette subfamily B protein